MLLFPCHSIGSVGVANWSTALAAFLKPSDTKRHGRRQLFLAVVLCSLLFATGDAHSTEWIVFGSQRSGNGDLYAIVPSTGEPVLFVGGSAGEGTPRWDPARNRVVHHRFVGDRAVLVADGLELFDDPNGDVAPQWAPGGRQIVYSKRNGDAEHLWIARPDGSEPFQVTAGRFLDRYPNFCTDDEVIFARRAEEVGWDLYLLDLPSGVISRLTSRERYVGHPSCSPDGRRIAFDTFFEDHADIAVLDRSNGAIERLTRRPGNDLIPAWSPDGTTIVFGGEPQGSANWDIWSVPAAGGPTSRLTSHPAADGGPIFVAASAIEESRVDSTGTRALDH